MGKKQKQEAGLCLERLLITPTGGEAWSGERRAGATVAVVMGPPAPLAVWDPGSHQDPGPEAVKAV